MRLYVHFIHILLRKLLSAFTLSFSLPQSLLSFSLLFYFSLFFFFRFYCYLQASSIEAIHFGESVRAATVLPLVQCLRIIRHRIRCLPAHRPDPSIRIVWACWVVPVLAKRHLFHNFVHPNALMRTKIQVSGDGDGTQKVRSGVSVEPLHEHEWRRI